MLPAAAPAWAVSTFAFRAREEQPATPAPVVGLAGADGGAGVVAGALDAAGALDGVEPRLVPEVLGLELHAAARSAVHKNTVVPSTCRVTGVINDLLGMSRT